jgi:hypothetical protein
MPSSSRDEKLPPPRTTWNTPEDIAKHRAMTPGERIKKTVEISNETARLAHERGVPFDQILFERLDLELDDGDG